MNMNGSEILSPAILMPDWLCRIEKEYQEKTMESDEDKIRFTIFLASENVRRKSGGPFGAAIFELKTGKLIACGVNSVVPAKLSWAHAEMTAFSNAQNKLQTFDLKGYMLASSCEPCAMCLGATPWSGVEELIYGASREAAERVGFDEGEKPLNWHDALRRRGIAVRGPMLAAESEEPFQLYARSGGIIY